MRKAVFLVMTIIIVAALILPVLDINWSGGRASDPLTSPESNTGTSLKDYTLPFDPIAPEMCTLESSYKEDWDLIVCESFDDSTDLWEGNSTGTTVSLEDGAYVVDNTETAGRIDTSGYTLPILIGAADNAMMSVTGTMDCLEGECAWGVFMRSTLNEIVYVFMIDGAGNFTLTGLSTEEVSQDVGNIQSGSHPSILLDGENTITGIAEGTQMMFYVNDQLLASHKANDATNPAFGLIVWGGLGAKAVNRIESVLARGN
ncbi:MAG: hypothetical protein Q7J07_07495 [Pelolinea sp.]|nr:hypothetical protein [Pelolinea sp.]